MNPEARSTPDQLLLDIAAYVSGADVGEPAAYESARYCLMDALGCAFHALDAPECVRLLGPDVDGITTTNGARVPGTAFELDPAAAAFSISTLVRWLDFNDTWWTGGHPSDNLGALLAAADFLSRRRKAAGKTPLRMRDVMSAMIKAYEVQGVLSEGNKIDRPEIALDSVMLVKIASTAVAAHLLGGSTQQIADALSQAIVDGNSLNFYRVSPYAGPRKSWAAGDAASRALRLAFLTLRGEPGYPRALSAKTWGFQDALFAGEPLKAKRPFASHVIENIQFKLSHPAQRHAQTAAECAVKLYPLVKGRTEQIERIVLSTHQLAYGTINVSGPLPNFAARDHCLQYIAAAGLLNGDITTESYEDEFAKDPVIDALRAKMVVEENEQYTKAYSDPTVRANPNAIQVFFKDGTSTPRLEIIYPIGDPVRRKDGLPVLEEKFRRNVARRFSGAKQDAIFDAFADQDRLERLSGDEFMDRLIVP